MARVRCMMMQRDETLLIDAWLAYHGYLFGFENLTVFDNGSSDRQVIASLRRAERAGVDVRWGHRDMSDFLNKGTHFANVMNHWESRGDAYDFAIPLDCDEFLAVFTTHGLDCRRGVLHDGFDALLGERKALSFENCLINAPGRAGMFSLAHFPKSFLPAHSAGDIDHGFHAARSRLEAGTRDTRFTYLHFHNKPFLMTRELARRKLAPFVDADDPEALASYAGPNQHLVAYFSMSDADYLGRYEDRLLLGFPGFGNLLAAIGIESAFLGAPVPAWRRVAADQVSFMRPASGEDPVWFDGAAYFRENPDVGGAGWPAALHYARNGNDENRFAPAAILEPAAFLENDDDR